MKRDFFLSVALAVAIHASVLIAPLSMGNITEAHSIYRPISISIIHPRKLVTPALPADNYLQPESHARSRVPSKQTPVPVKKVSYKKHIVARSVTEEGNVKEKRPEEADRDTLEPVCENKLESVEESPGSDGPAIPGREIDSEATATTASIMRHILEGVAKCPRTPEGNWSGGHTVVDTPLNYGENPLPHYPKLARRRGYEGRTLLRVEVLANGLVGKIEIEASSGFEVLDTAALKSVKGWTFVPGTKNGRKIKQWVMVPVRFSLK